MTKKDMKYRQGRSKEQVRENEKITYFAVSGFLVILAALILTNLIKNVF